VGNGLGYYMWLTRVKQYLLVLWVWQHFIVFYHALACEGLENLNYGSSLSALSVSAHMPEGVSGGVVTMGPTS